MGEKPIFEHSKWIKMPWNPKHLLLWRFSLSDFLLPNRSYIYIYTYIYIISFHHVQVSHILQRTCNKLRYLQFSKAPVGIKNRLSNITFRSSNNKLSPKMLVFVNALKRSSFVPSQFLFFLGHCWFVWTSALALGEAACSQ